MSMAVPVETAEHGLKDLLARLRLGETITLVNPDGTPLAILISLKTESPKPMSIEEWNARWEALAEDVSRAWKSDKSAIEVLSEMRR